MAKAREVIATLPSGMLVASRTTLEGYYIICKEIDPKILFSINQLPETRKIISKIYPNPELVQEQFLRLGCLKASEIVDKKTLRPYPEYPNIIGIQQYGYLQSFRNEKFGKPKLVVQKLVDLINNRIYSQNSLKSL